MNDRASYGVRGGVKLCVEEITYPGAIGPDGKLTPEIKQIHDTEFDKDGRLISTRGRNGDGSAWIREHVYDEAGRLQRIGIQNGSSPRIDQVYTYDDDGRLLKITNSAKPDSPAVCQYDERGRKTMLQISRPEDFEAGGAVCGGSPFIIAAEAPNFPGGGSSETFYDENDRPYEVQVRSAGGILVNRVVCIYDNEGRLIEERVSLEDPIPTLPLDLQQAMIWPHNRKKLDEYIGNRKSSTVRYAYDDQGRLVKTQRSDGGSTELAYNEHGDKSSEITHPAESSGLPFAWPPYSEAHYSYVYDDHGNWTEERTSYRSAPDGTLHHSGTRRRELMYYEIEAA